MATQTEESQNEDINAFFDLFEKFDDTTEERLATKRGIYVDTHDRIALFGLYVSRME